MPLILAIEPDRRQATQLTSVVRSRLHADLVLAESAERALAALGDRVPDLILTSALLSPKDEGALAERLRALNGAAAHVQTLTIPVLAPPRPRSKVTRGLLSALRRERPESPAPDGCDPAVFADQCAAYLDRAAAERAQVADAEEAVRGLNAETAESAEQSFSENSAFEATAEEPVVLEAVAERDVEDPTPDVAQPFILRPDALRVAPSSVEGRQAQDAAELAEWDLPLPEFEIVASKSEQWEDAPFSIEHDLSQLIDAISCQEVAAPPHADDEPRTPVAFVLSSRWPPMEGVAAEAPAPVDLRAAEPMLPAVIAPWTTRAPEPLPSRSIEPTRKRGELIAARGARVSRGRPFQDEWGFFDPDQCGFAALRAKLEEMTKSA